MCYELNTLRLFNVNVSIKSTLEEIKAQCSFLSDWGIKTLSNGLSGYVKSIVFEPNYICKDHRNLYSNYYSKKFINKTPLTPRLHFFSDNLNCEKVTQLKLRHLKKDYVGYSVIRNIEQRCLGRTIIDPCMIGLVPANGNYLLRTAFSVNINGLEFQVNGYPYMSQDTEATVCAHSALWSVCRYLSERYHVYSEIYPYDIINLTCSSFGRTYPYKNMTYSDYCSILSSFGAYPIVRMLKSSIDDPEIIFKVFRELYTYVESGFPILASIPGHVINIIGHSIDYEKQADPDDQGYIDSSQYLKQFIVVDDNFFPYRLLGFSDNDMNENYGANHAFSVNSLKTFVCPLPEKVFLLSEHVRETAKVVFNRKENLLTSNGEKPWVFRLFLTSSTSYKKRKLYYATKSNDALSFYVTNMHFPHFIWVVELSTVTAYKNCRIFAEIVFDASAGKKDNSIIYLRIGNTMNYQNKEKSFNGAPNYFRQYTHNLGETL